MTAPFNLGDFARDVASAGIDAAHTLTHPPLERRRRTLRLVVHCTANRPAAGGRSPAQMIEALRQHHVDTLGWSAVGYHEVILPSGETWLTRDPEAVGAGVAGFNSESYHIALWGGLTANGEPDGDAFTAAQWAALEDRLAAAAARYPGAGICGHRDLSPDRDGDGVIEEGEHIKACPCFDAIPWAAGLGLPVLPISGEWDLDDPRRPTPPDARTVYLQGLLDRAGFDFGPNDGALGPRTVDAIEAYQRERRLPVTGAFDPPTVARLRAEFESDRPEPAAPAAPSAARAEAGRGLSLGAAGAAAVAWFGGLAPIAQAAVILGAAALAVYLWRAIRRREEELGRERAGDALPEPEADLLDWVAAYARAALKALGAGLRGALIPSPAAEPES